MVADRGAAPFQAALFCGRGRQDWKVERPGMARRSVVIGEGVAGWSVAWHLAKQGAGEVLMIERDRLGSGIIWHSADTARPPSSPVFGSAASGYSARVAEGQAPWGMSRGSPGVPEGSAAPRPSPGGHGRARGAPGGDDLARSHAAPDSRRARGGGVRDLERISPIAFR